MNRAPFSKIFLFLSSAIRHLSFYTMSKSISLSIKLRQLLAWRLFSSAVANFRRVAQNIGNYLTMSIGDPSHKAYLHCEGKLVCVASLLIDRFSSIVIQSHTALSNQKSALFSSNIKLFNKWVLCIACVSQSCKWQTWTFLHEGDICESWFNLDMSM